MKPVMHYSIEDLIRGGEKEPEIEGMSYKSARDELFFVVGEMRSMCGERHDKFKIRMIHLCEKSIVPRDVYTAPEGMYLEDVCHIAFSDTLLVFRSNIDPNSGEYKSKLLVAFNRYDEEWLETHCVETTGNKCYALGESQVLVGDYKHLEVYSMKSGLGFEFLYRIDLSLAYSFLATKPGSDTIVATCTYDGIVRVHQLSERKLEELARIQLQAANDLIWLPERILIVWKRATNASERDAVIELEFDGELIQRRRELTIELKHQLWASLIWCAAGDGFAIADASACQLDYFSFASA